MKMPHFYSVRWLAALSLAWSATASYAQTPQVTFHEGGIPRTFEIATDELVVARKGAPESLRAEVGARMPGAEVLSERRGEVHVKLAAPIDRAAAAAGKAALTRDAAGSESMPVLYPSGAPHNDRTRRLATSEVLVQVPEGQTGEAIGALVGATSVRATRAKGVVALKLANGFQALAAAETLGQQGFSAQPTLMHTMEKRSAPNDPFFANQWHLLNSGQGNGLPGIDANVLHAWDLSKGAGVTIAIIDDSFEPTHEDLSPNSPAISTGFHHDFNDVDNDPSPDISVGDQHGVSVGGVAGARGNNLIGVSGSAPEAQLVGLRLISGFFTDQDAADAFTWGPAGLTVSTSNNSWGPYDGSGVHGPDFLAKQALQDAAQLGRGGKGTVTVFAAGNGLQYDDNSNFDGYANSRFVLAVGAIDNLGLQPYYGEPGANILVGAPTNGGSLGIFTTDVTGGGGYNPGAGEPSDNNYTNSFGGTSSAAPLTTGGVALMLAANDQLGWRDVQEILASTAVQINPLDTEPVYNPTGQLTTQNAWVTNGGGFHFNHKWGGGMINLTAAVVRARDWVNLAPEESQTVALATPNIPAAIQDNKDLTRQFVFTDTNLRVEHVELFVDISHAQRSDVEIIVTSPDGTKSLMAPTRPRPDYFFTGDDDRDYANWTFSSTHHWGENSTGTWTVRLRDRATGSEGILRNASLSLYGTPAPMQRVRFTQARTNIKENAGTKTLTVERLGGTTGAISVDYVFSADSTATAGTDFTAVNGTLNFADGVSTMTVAVPVLDDALIEGRESIFVLLKNPVGAALGGINLSEVQIDDNETNFVTITATDPDAAEVNLLDPFNVADTGTFTVAFQVPVTVNTDVYYTLSGGAFKNADFTNIPDHVTVPSGSTSATITISPIDDNTVEGAETVIVKLASRPTYSIGAPSEATVTIFDNEKTNVNLTATNGGIPITAISEGSANPVVAFTVTRGSVSSEPLDVPLVVTGSARPVTDYTPAFPDSIEIPANELSASFNVTIVNDPVYRRARILKVTLGDSADFAAGFNKSAQLTITDNQAPPDTRSPRVKITTPLPRAKMTAPAVGDAGKAKGTASDSGTGTVAQVIYRVNGQPWRLATGTNTWEADLLPDVIYGTNTLEVRAIDNDANQSLITALSFDYLLSRELTIQATGAGTIRGASGPRFAGFPVTVTAAPGTGAVFDGWADANNNLLSTAKIYTFPMPAVNFTLVGRFTATPFKATAPAITGSYVGLVEANNFSPDTSGYLQVNVLNSGAFSGFLNFAGVRYPLRGDFTGHGRFRGVIPRKFPLSQLSLDLTLDVASGGSERVTGTVNSPDFTCTVSADRGTYSATNPVPAAVAGKYTLHIPSLSMPNSTDPRGQGAGTLTITPTGVVTWLGTLPDGTAVTQSTQLSKGLAWPLYLTPYRGGGVAIGAMVVASQGGSQMNGLFDWQKAVNVKDSYYSGGFLRENNTILGARYTVPTRLQSILNPTVALSAPPAAGLPERAIFREGNLISSAGISKEFEKAIRLNANNAVTVDTLRGDRLAIRFTLATGAFTGTFTHPQSGKVTPIRGAVFQASGQAFGSFLGTVLPGTGTLQAGTVLIDAPAP